ncbi:tyrosine-type recombinase/integrase [Afifella sp. H1R]|uniref:tyrosine-type recombinase/integrase n=1 Tax=Afifella sp. H1R TaxID=2908841 RepID=UPI00351CD17D
MYRRGKIWWGRATRAGKEHRKSLGTQDRRVAETRLRNWLNQLDKLKWGEKPARRWEDVWPHFLEQHAPTIKRSSLTRYGVSLKNLSRVLDGKTIQDVGTALLSDFVAMRRGDGVTSASIRRDLTCLSLIIAYCEEWEWVEAGSNPVPTFMRRMRRRGLKESPPRTRYLSPAEEEALLAHMSEPCRTAAILSIDTGLRDQEIFDLKWYQIDFDAGLVRTTTKTKSGKARVIPLLPRSAQILAQRPRHFQSPYVICHADGTRYGRTIKAFQTAARHAGIADLKWHDLRRTAGCRWLQRDGYSMEEVSWFLGHSSVQVTEKSYAFLDLEASAQKTAQTHGHHATNRRQSTA